MGWTKDCIVCVTEFAVFSFEDFSILGIQSQDISTSASSVMTVYKVCKAQAQRGSSSLRKPNLVLFQTLVLFLSVLQQEYILSFWNYTTHVALTTKLDLNHIKVTVRKIHWFIGVSCSEIQVTHWGVFP